jgi:hypothetical protein
VTSDPSDDGLTHINVYGKAKTRLGAMLSNFAKTPFDLRIGGEVHRFESVEGWWYWRYVRDDELKVLYGYRAKELGRRLRDEPGQELFATEPPTREELRDVYLAKVMCNPDLRKRLVESTLPFDHYYVYGGKRRDTDWQWTGTLWNEVREIIRGVKHG